PFQGLPELVAYDEGLFEKEGLDIEWVDRDAGAEKKKTVIEVSSPRGLNPFTSHGRLVEQGQADMYNACEWGNYCRVQETGIKSPPSGPRPLPPFGPLRAPAGVAGLHAAAARESYGRRAVLFWHALPRAPLAGGLRPPRGDQGLPCPERLPSPPRFSSERRDRGDDSDRALHHAGREARVPDDLLRVLPRDRGRVRAGRRPNLCRVQPRGARSSAAHQCRQARLPPLLHRLPRPG